MPNQNVIFQTGFAHLSDLPCLKLQYGSATAVISLYGAQVLSYQPAPEQEILWLSPKAQWHNHTPIRGGVPVCWPWFSAVDSRLNPAQHKLPNHGVVRNRMWQFDRQSIDAQAVSIVLTVQIDDLPQLNQPVTLQLHVTLADKLTINLQCATSLLQQGALHSYFCIENLDQTRLQPLPAHYIDKVSNKTVFAASSVADITAEVDRIYPAPAPRLQLTDNTMAINIDQCGQDTTIVWNPWQEKSRLISDLPDAGYLHFVCVETARLQLNTAEPLNLTQQLTLS
jgi:glucose-6-phosphate 1-epimerase